MNPYEPYPIYDEKEKQLLLTLTADYEKFIEPKKVNEQLNKLAKKAFEIIPNDVTDAININEQAFYQKLMKNLTGGFETAEKLAANFTVNEKAVLKDIEKDYPFIDSIDKITYARSYDIQKIVNKKVTANYVQAFVEGATTGAPGVVGLPFNIILSIFLYYRTVQNIAMHYGYDVKGDPKELEFAGEVFISAFTRGSTNELEGASALIGKIMLQGELTALKTNINKLTLQKLAEEGGAQLIYVQIRALANKVAADALKSAGKKNLEKSIFKNILTVIGKSLPKRLVSKTVPVIGGVVGAIFDTNYMNTVIKGASLIYHKRFLIEKETRIKLESNNIPDFLDVEFEEFIKAESSEE